LTNITRILQNNSCIYEINENIPYVVFPLQTILVHIHHGR